VFNPGVIFDVHSNNNSLEDCKVVGRELAFAWEGLVDVVWRLVLDALKDRPVNVFASSSRLSRVERILASILASISLNSVS